jgi:hypothetical protein
MTNKVTAQAVFVNVMNPCGWNAVIKPRIHERGAKLDELSASHYGRINPRQKKDRYEINTRWSPGGVRSVEHEEEINRVHLSGFEPQFLGRTARSLVAALTGLSFFHF